MKPLAAGEWVRLTDAKGRKHNFELRPGAEFSTKKGQIRHDDILQRPEGIVVQSSLGHDYQVFRPTLHEYAVSMPRGAAIVYPKDAGQILTWADIAPGQTVVEAGAGSGSLSIYLLRAIGADGRLSSYEIRDDFAERASSNVSRWFGEHPAQWTLTVGDVKERIVEDEIDRLLLDMVDPWSCIELAVQRLVPGGVVCAYIATTTQMSRFVETLRSTGDFTEPQAFETIQRGWHLQGLAVRPEHSMVGHTAYLVTARRMAPNEHTLQRYRRPAPGAYGADYVGPRPYGWQERNEASPAEASYRASAANQPE